ncbi:sugar transferase [Dolichospermum sp. ST_con]|nr:sugar transferase [Dolichospermum sp. ST_con]MDD1419720.1 sugar transferase [Dolichospermum sp. ST_sed1]MDD1424589.1 sugar transferase [Dolichospermum sp. ST_sed9]MDD1432387.1 sugar transferase [Dolichospermum sp. ST_sed6]MDD1435277.1 sugar transferase [Dolichospermum sp. ST_sed10]MDD1440311.1 sugar transferase [Dolichospermum sp. ST_sed3]MDD1447805.1 sugar transferase [Dolichospermum sp. ST_sed8]MDD1455802.1 sugar transferase [Dolichospermum sp. ST_sed7]MDD1459713.1 sugar transferase [D
MPISVISSLNKPSENISFLSCSLQWRRGKLLVKTLGKLPQIHLAALENEESLIECLKHSPVSLVSIDPKIGDSLLKVWANACQKANKPIFMNISSHQKLPKKENQIFRTLQIIIDWTWALLLLLFMSPVILGGLITMQIYSPKLLFDYEWYMEEHGQLFRAIKFSSKAKEEMTKFSIILGTFFLNNLSNGLNLFQGKFCLLNNRCLSLEDAVRSSLEEQDKKLDQQHKFSSKWQIDTKDKLPIV